MQSNWNFKLNQMSNQTQKNEKCCGCLSTISGVRLALLLEVLMSASGSYMAYQDLVVKKLKIDYHTAESQDTIQSVLITMASYVAMLSGAIGLFMRNRSCLRVFDISCMIGSVLWILICIWFTLGFTHVIHNLDQHEHDSDDTVNGLLTTLVIFSCIGVLRVYGNVNTHNTIANQDY
eukprot:14525_1